MQAWEYKVIHRVRGVGMTTTRSWDEPIVSQLPALGDEGWELVSVVARSSEPGSATAGVTSDEMWVFKRPKTILSAETTVIVAQADEPVDVQVETADVALRDE
jgi:hypothetical protein